MNIEGLRQFFLAHLKSGRQYVSMPSQVADELWHDGDGGVPYCGADLGGAGGSDGGSSCCGGD